MGVMRVRIKYQWPDGFRHSDRSGMLFNGARPNRLIDRIARGVFYPMTVMTPPTVWAPYLWLDVGMGSGTPAQLRRKAYQFRNAVRQNGIPIGAPTLPPALSEPSVGRRQVQSPFRRRLPGFGQAEEAVTEATERTIWPQVIAAGSVGVIVLGLVYGMGKQTIGRAY